METLKEEEEELKRKVEQCKVSRHLEFPGWEEGAKGGSCPHFKEGKLKLGGVVCLTQRHTAGKRQSQDLNPGTERPSS